MKDQYLESRSQFLQVSIEMEKQAKALEALAACFRKPQSLKFTIIRHSDGSVKTKLYGDSFRSDSDAYETVHTLYAMASELIIAQNTMSQVWSELSELDRRHLPPPTSV